MNNLILNWKRIRRGLPHGREAANDRAPTLEEIQRLVECPDRLIKSINEPEAQYLMHSHGQHYVFLKLFYQDLTILIGIELC